MTRDEAFQHLLSAIEQCIPNTEPGWADRRAAIHDAAMDYCHAAVAEVITTVFKGLK